MKNTTLIFILLLAQFLACVSMAQNHKGLNFQMMVTDPGGSAVSATNVSVNLKVLSANDCILLEENHTSVAITNGYLNVVVGKGTRSGSDKAYTLKQVFDNRTARSSLDPLSGSAGSCTYTPTADKQDARKLRVYFLNGTDPVLASFNIRSSAFAVQAEEADSLQGKFASDLVQVNAAKNLTQTKLEEFFQNITASSGQALKWNGSNFVAYDPTDGSLLAAVPWSILTSVPSNISGIAALSCSSSQVIKRNAGNTAWVCAADNDSGGGGGGSGTVTSVAAGTGLTGGTITTTGTLAVDVGTTAGKIVQVATGDKYPAMDGSNITALSARANLSSGTVAAARMPALTGDVTTSAGAVATSVVKIRGTAVSSTAPTSSLQVLKYDGGSQWAPTLLGIADIRSTATGNAQFFPTNCTAAQTLVWQSVTDVMACTNIAISASNVTSGTLAIARGGTALSALGSSNQILGVNSGGTAMEYKTLAAGSGISLTHGTNSITIDATGGGGFASQSANTVFAAPDGSAGTPSFRALASADIPNLSTDKLTAGTLPIARGGSVPPSSAVIATAETTTSTTFTDLATVGPQVTVNVQGTTALVTVTAKLYNGVVATSTLVGFEVSGASTIAATDNKSIEFYIAGSGSTLRRDRASATYLITGLTPGNNTFTAKYRVTGGTGTFLDRNLIVQPY